MFHAAAKAATHHEPRRDRCPQPSRRSEARRVLACVTKIAELRSAGQMRASVPTWFVVEIARESAGELIAGQLQAVEIAEDRHCN